MVGRTFSLGLRPGFFLLTLGACVPHTLGGTEVGVQTANIALVGNPGVLPEVYESGSTYLVPLLLRSWYVFDAGVQNLVMTGDPNTGAREGDDALQFKTYDGNDISVDVTVTWHIDKSKAPYLLQFIGEDTTAVEERLVRPVVRTVLRDVLNELRSEEYYDAALRFARADQAREACNHYLNPEGAVVDQVILGEHKFNPEYEQVIKDKTVAEQDASRLRSEAEAVREGMRQQLEVSKGKANQLIEQARGEATRKQLEADAAYFQRQQEAEATLAEARARTEGLKAQARAMAGAGGTNMVKIKVAEAISGKPILFLPSGGELKTMDMNQLLLQYGVTKD